MNLQCVFSEHTQHFLFKTETSAKLGSKCHTTIASSTLVETITTVSFKATCSLLLERNFKKFHKQETVLILCREGETVLTCLQKHGYRERRVLGNTKL